MGEFIQTEEWFGTEGGGITSTSLSASFPYAGQEFTSPNAFNSFEFYAQLTNTQNTITEHATFSLHEGPFASNAPSVRTVVLPIPYTGNPTPLWHRFDFETLPAGTYHARLQYSIPSWHRISFYTDNPYPSGAYFTSSGVNLSRDMVFKVYYDLETDIVVPIGKRWDGTTWAPAGARRWDGAEWITLPNIERVKSRYYSTEQFLPGIRSAATITEMVSVPDVMEADYGVKLSAVISNGSRSNASYDEVLISAPESVPAYEVLVQELSKYPVSLLRSGEEISVLMAANLRSGGTTLGGIAYASSNLAYLNITPEPLGASKYSGTRFRAVDFIFHHELQHLLRGRWSSDFSALSAQWTTLNPEPYIGDSYAALSERPLGHIREYGRHSYGEDIADVHAAIMTTSMQSDLQEWMSEDPALAAKVNLMKDFLASKSTEMSRGWYFNAIHAPVE